MSPALIIDENLPPRWCDFLATFGIKATPWRDIGSVGDPDEVIFDYAQEHKLVIVTQDLDFTHLLARGGAILPSVIQLRMECPIPEVVGHSLVQVLETHRQQLHNGCLISLDHKRHRLRLLPLR